jgi:arylsulfatase A-like enzyme
MRAVRTERYKYIRSFEDRPHLLLALDIEYSPTRYGLGDDHLRRRPSEELYDLHGDPLERHNLAASPGHAEQREELAAMLQQWRVATGDPLLAGPIPAKPRPRHPQFGAIVR